MADPEAATLIAKVPPFSTLDAGDLARVADALTPAWFAPGETVVRRFDRPEALFLVAEGMIEETDQSGPVGLYAPGDSFDTVGLINGRSENSFISRNRARCFLLPAQLFHAFARSNSAFRDYYQKDLSRRQDKLVTLQQQREASSFLLARIGERDLHPPVFVEATATIEDATRLMHAREASAILVRRGDAIGIFTERDVRERHVLAGMPKSTPIGELATYTLHTLDRDDFLFNALVLMTERAIRHVVVTERNEVVGIFEQADLLGYLYNSSYVIADKVERASTEEELRAAGNDVPTLIRTLFDRGVKPRHIARIVTDLNRKIFRRVFRQLASPDLQSHACLIVMGSEGRGEQLLRTDQDNALIFDFEPSEAEHASLGQPFTTRLIDLGYPPCPGDVMVSNQEWAKSLTRYKQDLRDWIVQPTREAFLKLAILIDAAPVAGKTELFGDLKAYMLMLIGKEEAFAGHFARAVLNFPTPLGFFNRFVTERGQDGKQRLDIKKGGIFPIVHGVRSLAVEYRIAETNTIGRIQALVGRGPFSEGFTADLIEAFDFMTMLRLREQFAAVDRGEAYDNTIDVATLSGFERNLLRDSFKIVKQFKAEIAHHFRLELLT